MTKKVFDVEEYIRQQRGEPNGIFNQHLPQNLPLDVVAKVLGKRKLRKSTADLPCYVYFIENLSNKFIKIGRANNLKSRLSSLQTALVQELRYKSTILCQDQARADKIEKALHLKFKQANKKGEWFDPVPELLDFIENFTKDSEELNVFLGISNEHF